MRVCRPATGYDIVPLMIGIEASHGRELVDEAVTNLVVAYEHLAASEALMRALVCERTEKSTKAEFWVQVYLSIRKSADLDTSIAE